MHFILSAFALSLAQLAVHQFSNKINEQKFSFGSLVFDLLQKAHDQQTDFLSVVRFLRQILWHFILDYLLIIDLVDKNGLLIIGLALDHLSLFAFNGIFQRSLFLQVAFKILHVVK